MSAAAGIQNLPAGVDRQNPWPGLASYTEAQSAFFFGRATETAELFRLVRRAPLTVLFGQSGLGKTSLLQAALFPRLREADLLPLLLRLDHDEKAPPLAAQVRAVINRAIEHREVDAPPCGAEEELWEYFHRKDVDFWSARNRLIVPVLVFDQFEEIFTLGRATPERRERGQRFLEELADLVEQRPSAALRARLEAGTVEAARFDFDHEFCKVVLSLREDYLADLEMLRPLMRSLGSNRIRIARLQPAQALEAVAQPGSEVIEPGVAEQIVQFVAGADERAGRGATEVDPALLSLVCRELNLRRLQNGDARITSALLQGTRREILLRFYEQSFTGLAPEMRVFVEDRLLTKSGFRDNIALENALAEPGVTREAIDHLVNRRLLRLEERLGVSRVELTHDVLTGIIRASRDTRREREAREELRRTQERAAAQRRRALIINWTVSAALIVAVIATAFAVYVGLQARDQSLARRLASQANWVLRSPDRPVEVGILLAAESLKRSPTFEGDSALRLGLALLPEALGPAIPEPGAVHLAIEPGGRYVVTGTTNRGLSVWETAGGTRVSTLAGNESIRAMTLGARAGLLAAATRDAVFVWRNWTNARPPAPLVIPGPASALGLSVDERYLAVGRTSGGTGVEVFDLREPGRPVGVLPTPTNGTPPHVLAFDATGMRLAVGSIGARRGRVARSATVDVWTWSNATQVARLPADGNLTQCGFTPDATGCWTFAERRIQVYQAGPREWGLGRQGRDWPGRAVVISPDGALIATSVGSVMRIWREQLVEAGEMGVGLAAEPTEVARITATQLAFSSANQVMVSTDGQTVQAWRTGDPTEVAHFTATSGQGGYFMSFSGNGRFLAVADQERFLVQEIGQGGLHTFETPATTVAFNRDAQALATVGPTNVNVWRDFLSPEARPVHVLPAAGVKAAAFSPDDRYLALLLDDRVELWESWQDPARARAKAGTHLRLAPPDNGDIAVLAFTPDGRHLGAQHGERVAVWAGWDTPQARLITQTNLEANATAFSASGRVFAACNLERVTLLDVISRTLLSDFTLRDVPDDVALSPDGTSLIVAGGSRHGQASIDMWSIRSREQLVRLNFPAEPGRLSDLNVVASPDGRYLATRSGADVIQVWALRAEDLIALARQRVRGNMSEEVWKTYLPDLRYRQTFPGVPTREWGRRAE